MYAPWRRRRLRSALIAGLEGFVSSVVAANPLLCYDSQHSHPYVAGATLSHVVLGCTGCGQQDRVSASNYVALLLGTQGSDQPKYYCYE